MDSNILEKIPYEKIWAVPPWQRWLAAGGAIFLFFVIFYFVSYKEAGEKIVELTGKRNKLQADYVKYEKYTQKMPQIEKDIAKLKKDLIKAKVQLPKEKEIPELLTLISNTGTRGGLEFLLFKPLPEKKVDFYSKVPVQMMISGGFHDTAAFFDKVKNMMRIVDISNVKIRPDSKKKGMLKTSCNATTYKYLEGQALKIKKKIKKKKK